MLNKLQETNHSLRAALEDQMQRAQIMNEAKQSKREEEGEDEEEDVWWKAARSPDPLPNYTLSHSPPPPGNRTHSSSSSPRANASRSPSTHRLPIYGDKNFPILETLDPTGPNLPLHTHLSPSPPGYPLTTSPPLSFLPSATPPPSFAPSATSFVPPGHLRRELDDLDKEIEQLQTSLKRQLSEMAGPT